jgi:transposase-like protein
VIYTTNSIEALHRQLRKIIKTVRHERRRRSRVEKPCI